MNGHESLQLFQHEIDILASFLDNRRTANDVLSLSDCSSFLEDDPDLLAGLATPEQLLSQQEEDDLLRDFLHTDADQMPDIPEANFTQRNFSMPSPPLSQFRGDKENNVTLSLGHHHHHHNDRSSSKLTLANLLDLLQSEFTPVTCPTFSDSFPRVESVRRPSEQNTKNHQCPHCSYRSKRSFDLARHMVTHTNEKKHQCAVCFRRFKRSDGLKRHKNFRKGKCSLAPVKSIIA